MGLQKLSLTMINVRDFATMRDFYGKTLGLEMTEVHEEGEWATFRLPSGGAEFALHGGLNPASGSGGIPPIVPSIAVEDIQATVEELKSRGVNFVRDVHETMPGLKLADFADPEGNVINLYESSAGTHGS